MVVCVQKRRRRRDSKEVAKFEVASTAHTHKKCGGFSLTPPSPPRPPETLSTVTCVEGAPPPQTTYDRNPRSLPALRVLSLPGLTWTSSSSSISSGLYTLRFFIPFLQHPNKPPPPFSAAMPGITCAREERVKKWEEGDKKVSVSAR